MSDKRNSGKKDADKKSESGYIERLDKVKADAGKADKSEERTGIDNADCISADTEAAAAELVADVRRDYEERRSRRMPLELQWRLNMNFVAGNQYAEITPLGEVEDYGKQYYWQQREVYNHIASVVETRLSKLSRVKTGIAVRPSAAITRTSLRRACPRRCSRRLARKWDLRPLSTPPRAGARSRVRASSRRYGISIRAV